MTVKPVSVERLAVPEGSAINFGAVIEGVDIENLTGKHQILVKIINE